MYGKKSDYLQNKIISYKSITIVVIGLFFIIIFYILEHFFELASYKGLLVIVLIIIPLVLLLNFIGNKSLLKSFNYSQGKRGEENIWYVLKKLPNEYCVFQDIKMRRGNVDFVVLGPTGLFVVEVKSHHGEVEFDGQELTNNGKRFEKDFLKQAKGEALQISNFLKNKLQQDVFIQSIVVFSNYVKIHFGMNKINGVYVIQKNYLQKLITVGSQRFSKEEILEIKDKLKTLVT